MVAAECNAQFLALRQQRRPRVFVSRVLAGIWTQDKVTREWSKVHVEELNDLYVLADFIRLT